MAVAPGDGAVNNGETNAHSLAGVFRGEEWLENALFDLGAHADSGVMDANAHVGPGWNVGVGGDCYILTHHYFVGFDGELAAVGHGPGTIDHEGDDYLLEFVGIHGDFAHSRQQGHHFDVCVNMRPENSLDVENDVVDRDKVAPDHAFASKHPQLSDHIGCPRYRLHHLFEVGVAGIVGVHGAAGQVSRNDDVDQEPVEIIGYVPLQVEELLFFLGHKRLQLGYRSSLLRYLLVLRG